MTHHAEGILDMLILTRKPGDIVTIGRSITLKVIQAGGQQVRIGVEAPQEVPIRADRSSQDSVQSATALTLTPRG
jgi:carbon storage regulator